MKIIKSTKNSTGGNVAIKAATNKNSSVRLQMKEELMDQILSEIKSKLKEIMTSYQFGYDDNEWEDYSGADIYLDNRGYIVITVYAEVSYNGLVKLMDALNPIVEKYDSDAYFDADTPGRCCAYIDPDNVPSNMYPYDDIQNSEKGEMIDYGFKSLEDAQAAIDEYDDVYQDDIQVYSATDDDGEGYWFFTTHGAQPGSVPKDVDILDITDTPNGSFVKFDRFLSTKELNEYDMVEKAPKSVMSAESEELIAEDNPWVQEIDWVMSQLPSWFEVNGSNLEYDVTYDDQTVHVEFFLFDDAKYTYYIDGHGPYATNQSERIGSDIEDYINEKFEDIMSATEEEYDEEELQDIIDELTADGFDVTDEADLLMGLGADLGMDRSDARYYAKLILNHIDDSSVFGAEEDEDSLIEIHASADTVEGASNEVELDPEESMIDMNIDQYIIVDSEGSWDYDSDNYDWASSDGEGSDWYSDNGVRLDDPTGVVEKIDELIEPHIPIEPGTYRVQGYIELYYTVSGVYENRYDYTEDDYSSDINSDFGSAEYNKKLSKIENVKVTKI